MKKLILILFFFLFVASTCDKRVELSSSYVYEQSYGQDQKVESIHDLYTLTHNYGLDSIPLTQWNTFTSAKENNGGQLTQKIITKYNDSINYIFVYTIFGELDTIFYQIKVRKIINSK